MIMCCYNFKVRAVNYINYYKRTWCVKAEEFYCQVRLTTATARQTENI